MKKILSKLNIKKIIVIAVVLALIITVIILNSYSHKYSDIFKNGENISDSVEKINIKKTADNFYIDVVTSLDTEKEEAESICKKFRNLALKDDNIKKILNSYGKNKPVITVRIDVGDDGLFNYVYNGIYTESVSSEYLGDKYETWTFADSVTLE